MGIARVDGRSSNRQAVSTALRWVFTADRRAATASAAGQVLVAASALALVAFSRVLVQRLTDVAGRSALHVLWPVFALAVLTSVTGLLSAVAAQRARVLGEKVEQTVWNDILLATSRVDLVTYESEGFTTRLARLEQSALARPLATVRAVFSLLGSLLTSAVMVAALAYFHPVLPLVLLAAAVPTILLGRVTSRAEYRFVTANAPVYMRRQYLRTVLTRRESAAEMRMFDAAALLRPMAARLDEQFLRSLTRQVRRRTALTLGGSLLSLVALIGVLAVIVVLVDDGRLDLARAAAAAIAARFLASSLTQAYASISTVTEAAPHLNDLTDFVAEFPDDSVVAEPLGLRTAVSLRDVAFRYPAQQHNALEGVHLEIGAGEVVALLGENGSGKTTLARIVSGLFEPGHGQVLWDGQSSEAAVRRRSISMLTQDFGRYALSASDNVSIGDAGRPLDVARRDLAARNAAFEAAVEALPEGWSTVLGRELDEGSDLSGGQWQRLALARALYRHADLIVLDEPSAALDPRAEAELFDDVRRILSGRSALLISHRVGSARLADRIYVLDRGRVLESGTHEQLMANAGRYRELFELQSAAYRSGESATR